MVVRLRSREGGCLELADGLEPGRVQVCAEDVALCPVVQTHRVDRVPRGVRWAGFRRVQSLIADVCQRALRRQTGCAIVRVRRYLSYDNATRRPFRRRLPQLGQVMGAALDAGPIPPARLAEAFRTALAEADAFVGATAPNPPVGCVLLGAGGAVLAQAAHQRAGEAHAEAAAIQACRAAGLTERIHTALVTLEPCSHTGRTPPCTQALLSTPVQAVWIGAPDPHPRAPGAGADRLADAGVATALIAELDHPDAAALAREAARLIAPFAKWSRTGRPWVMIKTALDSGGGMIPPPDATTFTSQASLAHAHRLRRGCEAIITGSGCILADDPSFTVRHLPDHEGRRRRLAILDRRGRTPDAYLQAAHARGLDAALYADIPSLLDELGAAGVLCALVEAGPTLRQAFLDLELWDEEIVFQTSWIAGAPDRVEVRLRPAA